MDFYNNRTRALPYNIREEAGAKAVDNRKQVVPPSGWVKESKVDIAATPYSGEINWRDARLQTAAAISTFGAETPLVVTPAASSRKLNVDRLPTYGRPDFFQ